MNSEHLPNIYRTSAEHGRHGRTERTQPCAKQRASTMQTWKNGIN